MTRSVEASAYHVISGQSTLRLGTLRHHPKGWKFYPSMPARLPSKKHYATKEEAIPSWVGKHTLQAVDDPNLRAARNMGWSV